jgi:hypothetical protein
MIKCPHCEEKTLPEFRINISPPDKIFQCSSCHKYSKTPAWHFITIMLIILITVVSMFTSAMLLVSSLLPIVLIAFKLFDMANFKMIPLESSDNINMKD